MRCYPLRRLRPLPRPPPLPSPPLPPPANVPQNDPNPQNMGDFLEHRLLEPSAAAMVRREVQSLCSELRPEAISLTDAWQFTDKYLGSVLGRNDG